MKLLVVGVVLAAAGILHSDILPATWNCMAASECGAIWEITCSESGGATCQSCAEGGHINYLCNGVIRIECERQELGPCGPIEVGNCVANLCVNPAPTAQGCGKKWFCNAG